MHCPQCGQQPPSEQTRYCTYCGFALSPLKEFLRTGTLPGSARQRDITLGAGLMLAGTIKAILLTLAFGGRRADVAAIFMLAAGAFFGLLQMFFQLSPRQKGLSLGATLMFLSALAGLLAGFPTQGFGTILVVIVTIPMILLWKRLAGGFSKVFFDKAESDGQRMVPPAKPSASLPGAQMPFAIDLDTDRMKQAAAFEPASIIENTTQTLREKQPSGAL